MANYPKDWAMTDAYGDLIADEMKKHENTKYSKYESAFSAASPPPYTITVGDATYVKSGQEATGYVAGGGQAVQSEYVSKLGELTRKINERLGLYKAFVKGRQVSSRAGRSIYEYAYDRDYERKHIDTDTDIINKLTERELDDLVTLTEDEPTTNTTDTMNPTDNTIATDLVDSDTAVIDEKEITDFHRGTVNNPFLYDASKAELEKFLLTCVFVAGKNAAVQQAKLDQFVECVRRDLGSYSVDNLGVISTIYNSLSKDEVAPRVDDWLREVKSGQYTRIGGCITSLGDKIGAGKLTTTGCNRGNLSSVKGIGLKTASFFLLYTRKNWGGACLDTHILRWMREELKLPNIPEVTPHVKEEYVRIENLFLKAAQGLNKSVPDLDFEIWSKYRK